MSQLFTPYQLGPVTLRNRTIRSAAFENMCPGNVPSWRLIDYHTSVARGGIGMTTVAYCSVDRSGVSFDGQLYIHDAIRNGLRQLADAVHAEGAKVSIQLGHCGNMTHRYTCGGRMPVGASSGFNLYSPTLVRGLHVDEIHEIVRHFGEAVDFCRDCGFDCVEIHAGHGYLISQFLSPYTNHRHDGYGGSLQNRMRLMDEVLDEVMAHAGPDMAVLVKTNMFDGFRRGLQVDDCIEVARRIASHEVHGIVLSAGFVSKAPMVILGGAMPLRTMAHYMNPWKFWWLRAGLSVAGRLLVPTSPYRETYFLDTARRFRSELDIPLVYVGGIQSRENCETVLSEGFELIQMAHVLVHDPAFVNHMRDSEEAGEGLSYRSACGRSNYCVGRMYSLDMKCHHCVENLPCSLRKEILKAEEANDRTIREAKG